MAASDTEYSDPGVGGRLCGRDPCKPGLWEVDH